MLKREDNIRLCQVTGDSPMGKVFRSYWIPALLSAEIPEPDCPPARVRILGENLVTFRDSTGNVGLIDRYCPHRRPELFWGRNEECGLRCVYHGWKFDVNGQCVDAPNEPDSHFKHKVKIKSYPTFEAAGIIWTYMGDPDNMPPKPNYEWLRTPETQVHVSRTMEHCNFMQALEGGIDTSHSSFAHNNDIHNPNELRNRCKSPKLEVIKTDYGFQYVGVRDLQNDGMYVRGYQFIMPTQQVRGQMTDWKKTEPETYPTCRGHIWVPIDDETTNVYNFMYSAEPSIPLSDDFVLEQEILFGRGPDDVLPDFRLKRNATNDYLIDRELQRTKTFTGIKGVNTQDYALQETMERPFVDRSQEKLGTADTAIIAARQLLLEASRQVEEGKALRGIDPQSHGYVRGCDKIIPPNTDWDEQMHQEFLAKY